MAPLLVFSARSWRSRLPFSPDLLPSQPAMNPNLIGRLYAAARYRLVLPRKSDAPELADLPPLPTEPSPALAALAQAQPSDQPPKREARAPVRKHPRIDPATRTRTDLAPSSRGNTAIATGTTIARGPATPSLGSESAGDRRSAGDDRNALAAARTNK